MHDDEWAVCCYLMEQAFQGDMPQEKRDAYRIFLDKFAPEQITAALHQLAETGHPYLPAVPEIVQACRKLEESPLPGWAEVYRSLIRALHVRVGYHDSEAEKTATCVRWLEDHAHAMVARFFEAQGYGHLSRLELDDPEYGALKQRDLQQRWEEFVDVARERLAQGRALAAAGDRAELGPRSLDAVALLSQMRPQVAGELETGGHDGDV